MNKTITRAVLSEVSRKSYIVTLTPLQRAHLQILCENHLAETGDCDVDIQLVAMLTDVQPTYE